MATQSVYIPPSVDDPEAATQPLLVDDTQDEEVDESLVVDDEDVQINLTRPEPEPEPPQVANVAVSSEPVAQLSAEAGYVQGIMHMPDLPDAVKEFEKGRPLLKLWLILSIISIVNSLFFWPGLLAGFFGVFGASLHVCECCRSKSSIAPYVNMTRIFSLVATILDSLIILLILIQLCFGCSRTGEKMDEEEDLENEENGHNEAECTGLFIVLLFSFMWYSTHLFVSVKILAKCTIANRLFNPITSGVMVI